MLGYDHESFWDQTDKTLHLTFDAALERRTNEYNERVTLAWHIAGLGRVKKFPSSPKSLLHKPNGHAAAPIDKQTENLARWVKATGGKVIVRPRDE